MLKRFKKVKVLGKGSYGCALLACLRSDENQKFVIKEIVVGHMKPEEQLAAKKEADVLRQMSHSNIVLYIESFVEGSKLYIVMEYADGGDLSGLVSAKKASGSRWSEEEVMRIFVQICLALKHVHQKNILHRDLKSQNIFLTAKGVVKLGDFGIAKVLDKTDAQAQTQIGTPYYLSPEICDSRPYGRKSDVWSLGVVLFELLATELPFQASSLPALILRICSASPPWDKISAVSVPGGRGYLYSPVLIDLTKSMLEKSPERRPLVEDIVRTEIVNNHMTRLLSFTLKSGYGGAPLAPKDGRVDKESVPLKVEEIERNLESHHQHHREEAKKRFDADAKARDDRSQTREENLEKFRKWKQENRSRIKDEESEVVIAYRKPADDVVRRPEPTVQQQQAILSAPKVKSLAELKLERDAQDNFAGQPQQARRFRQESWQQQVQQHKPSYQQQQLPQPFQNRQDQDVRQAPSGRAFSGNADYASIASREYYANREAAKRFKDRYQALESASPSSYVDADPIPLSRQVSEQRYDEKIDEIDGEGRIAQIKAKKDKEREIVNEEYERKLQEAYLVNREAQRKLKSKIMQEIVEGVDQTVDPAPNEILSNREQNVRKAPMRGAVAFEITFDDTPSVRKNQPKLSRVSSSEVVSAASAVRVGGGEKKIVSPLRSGVNKVSGNSEVVENSVGAKPRKKWGPASDLDDIRARKATQVQSEQMKVDFVEEDEGISIMKSKFDGNEMTNLMVLPKYANESAVEVTRFDDDEGNLKEVGSNVAISSSEDPVLKRIESFKQQKEDSKEHALQLLKRLREQKLAAPKGRGGASVVSSKVDSRFSDRSPIRAARLGEVLGSVADAQAVVQDLFKADAKGQAESSSSTNVKKTDDSSDSEGDLDAALDGWLQQHDVVNEVKSVHVTLRQQQSRRRADELGDEMYLSVATQGERDPSDYNGARSGLVSDTDAEVSDLQCMLAQALLE